MTKETFKSYFKFSASQRYGILSLFALMILLQLFYYFADLSIPDDNSPEKQQWLSLRTTIDSLKKTKQDYHPKMYPFNPNFITDFKGYKLGMTVAEIDRLLEFRKTNKYVNSAAEFQTVTKVSDSLLNAIAPFFKFPDWVNKKNITNKVYSKTDAYKPVIKEKTMLADINQATQDDLIKIFGIGTALSERILKEKAKFGAFASMDQLQDVWGLSPEVIEQLNKHFNIQAAPVITKIKINDASIKELLRFPYFRYALAKEIVTFRSMNGGIHSTADLIKINGFPVEKVNIIALYLEF